MTTISGLQCIRFLDWVYEFRHATPGLIPQVFDYLRSLDEEPAEGEQAPRWINDVITILDDAGLVRLHKVLGGVLHFSVDLTERGVRDVIARRERRDDPRFRNRTARRNILLWLDSLGTGDRESLELSQIFTTVWATVEGEIFATAELEEARAYLEEKRLIRPGVLILTSEGVDCVENFDGNVGQYLSTKGTPAMTVYESHFGDVHGQVAIGNRDVQQSQTTGLDAIDLAGFIGSLREILHEIPEQTARDLGRIADQIEEENDNDSPDQSWLLSLAKRARRLLSGVKGVVAVGEVITQAEDVIRALEG